MLNFFSLPVFLSVLSSKQKLAVDHSSKILSVPMGTHRPLAWVTVCFGFGVWINQCVNLSFKVFVSLTVLLLILSVATLRRKILSAVLILTAMIGLGVVYAKAYQTSNDQDIRQIAKYYYKKSIRIKGVIILDIEKKNFGKTNKITFILDVKNCKTRYGWKKRSGKILVNLYRESEIRYGDEVMLEGKLHKPFEFASDRTFSYRDYLARRGISYILSVKKDGLIDILQPDQGLLIKKRSLDFKHRLNQILERNLSKEEASIMQALILGDRYNIPKDLYDLFKISGVAHILAISGFNIGIVAYVVFLILRIFPIHRHGQSVLTMLFLVFYAFLTGGDPPVVRATIMVLVFLSGFLIELESEPINTLSLAALIILLINPFNLFEVGFQLSFVSVLSIIIFYPKFMRLFLKLVPGDILSSDDRDLSQRRKKVTKLIGLIMEYFLQSMAVSLAAYLGVVVLIAYYFHLITPVVILANLVVIPLASLAVFLGLGILGAGWVCPGVAWMFANCIKVCLNLMVGSVLLFVQIPGAYFQVNAISIWIVIAYYICMAAICWIIPSLKFPKTVPGKELHEKIF